MLVSREDPGKSPKIWESSKVALPGSRDLSPGSDEGAPPRHGAGPSASANGQDCPSGSQSSDATCAQAWRCWALARGWGQAWAHPTVTLLTLSPGAEAQHRIPRGIQSSEREGSWWLFPSLPRTCCHGSLPHWGCSGGGWGELPPRAGSGRLDSGGSGP